MRWTVQEVARALGVAIPAGLDPLARLAGVSIDSRTVARGQLFVAIHGPRHDGHAFVAAALDAGALAAVVVAASASAELSGGDSRQALRRSGHARGAAGTGARGAPRAGAGASPRSPVRSARPPRRKFWRRCWARSSAS